MADCGFSIDHWRWVLGEALAQGYRFCGFEDAAEGVPPAERTILLRHDVDVSLETAARLAVTEAEVGIGATYFVRLHARFYRPLEPDALRHLYRLRDRGADIGLHYERQFYQAAGGDHEQMLAQDAGTLGGIIGRPVRGCARHLGVFPSFDAAAVKRAGLAYEAYEPQFVERRKYISDSARHWREGCLCRWLGREKHLTVLMHPVWWFEPAELWDRILQRIREGD